MNIKNIIILFIPVLFGIGLYNFLCYTNKVPTKNTTRSLLAANNSTLTTSQQFEMFMKKLSKKFAHLVKLNDVTRYSLQTSLDFAEFDLTPEEYTVRAILTGLLVFFILLILVPINKLFLIIAIGAGYFMGNNEYKRVLKVMQKRKDNIEGDIPQFSQTVSEMLGKTRNVVEILSEAKKLSHKEFRKELDRTIADMKSSSQEQALIRFDTRIGSTMLSEVIRGLIGVLRGDDEKMYFEMLSENLKKVEFNRVKKLNSIKPGKISMLSNVLLFCIMAIMFVAMGLSLVKELKVLF